MADHPQIIPFHRPKPAPKPARPKAQVVPIPSMSYRLLGRNLDAKATAARFYAILKAGHEDCAIAEWRSHVAQIEARAKGTASPAQIGRMVAAYRKAVRAEIDALKAQ